MRNARKSSWLVCAVFLTRAWGQSHAGADAARKQAELDRQVMDIDRELKAIPPCKVRESDKVFERVLALSRDAGVAWKMFFDDWAVQAGGNGGSVHSDAGATLQRLTAQLRNQLARLEQDKQDVDQRQQRYGGPLTKDMEEALKHHAQMLATEIDGLKKSIAGLDRVAESHRAMHEKSRDASVLIQSLKRQTELAQLNYELLLKSKQRARIGECEATLGRN